MKIQLTPTSVPVYGALVVNLNNAHCTIVGQLPTNDMREVQFVSPFETIEYVFETVGTTNNGVMLEAVARPAFREIKYKGLMLCRVLK